MPSVRNSYTEICDYLKTKGGSPTWARTTIAVTYSESVSYIVLNGLKCQIGPKKPALVHGSRSERRPDRASSSLVVNSNSTTALQATLFPRNEPRRPLFPGAFCTRCRVYIPSARVPCQNCFTEVPLRRKPSKDEALQLAAPDTSASTHWHPVYRDSNRDELGRHHQPNNDSILCISD